VTGSLTPHFRTDDLSGRLRAGKERRPNAAAQSVKRLVLNGLAAASSEHSPDRAARAGESDDGRRGPTAHWGVVPLLGPRGADLTLVREARILSSLSVLIEAKALERTTTNATPQPEVALNASRAFVVVLVHGTFASRAPWTQAGSRFREVLEQRLGNVHFEPFEWTGANSGKARRQAGLALRETLHGLRRRFPRALVYVVGHSHGGNVALYATKLIGPVPDVDGLVAIATPFLRARIRKVPKSTASVLTMVQLAAFWALISWTLSPSLVSPIQALLGPAVWVAFSTARMPRELYRRFRLWVARRQNAVILKLPWPVPKCRILNLQTSFDEARLHLTILGLLANALVLSIAAVPWLIVAGANLASVGAYEPEAADVATLGGMVGGVAIIILLPLVMLAAIGSIALRGHRFGFGDNGVDNLFVDIRPSKHPLSPETFLQETERETSVPFHPHWGLLEYMLPSEYRHSRTLPRAEDPHVQPEVTSLLVGGLRGRGLIPSLRHSRLYDSADVASVIAGWMLLGTVPSWTPAAPEAMGERDASADGYQRG
jgi:hypothetical protein